MPAHMAPKPIQLADVMRVQAEVLLLGVFDRDRAELGEEARAAALFDAACAESAEDLRHFAWADLAELEARAIQMPHAFAQRADFDALIFIARIQECERLPVEGIFGAHDLDRQPQACALRTAGDHRLELAVLVIMPHRHVAAARQPLDAFVRAAMRTWRFQRGNLSHLPAAHRIDDHPLAGLQIWKAGGQVVIHLADRLESNADERLALSAAAWRRLRRYAGPFW